MKKYIEQDIAIEQVGDLVATMSVCTSTDECFGMKSMKNRALDTLRNIPAADVVKIRHGKWVWDENGVDWGLGAWECSECHHKPETWWEADKGNPYRCAGSKFCPNCGAKMDEGVNNAANGR